MQGKFKLLNFTLSELASQFRSDLRYDYCQPGQLSADHIPDTCSQLFRSIVGIGDHYFVAVFVGVVMRIRNISAAATALPVASRVFSVILRATI